MTARFFSILVSAFIIFGIVDFSSADEHNMLKLQPGKQQSIDSAADIHDIYGPLILPEPLNLLPYLFVLLAIALTLGCAFLLYSKRQKSTAPPPNAPHKTALAELALARKYIESNQSLQYSQRVSEILRTYIEKRFNIQMTRQTSTEFLSAIQEDKSGPLLENRDTLGRCLELCDMAKYARKTIDKSNLQEMEKSIQFFVEETMEAHEE